jgi:hypothetical protein
MKKIVLTLYSLLAGIWLYGQSPNNTVAINEAGKAQAQHYMQSQKGGFEENKGQITGQDATRVKYSYKAKGLSVFLLNNGIAYQFSKTHYPEGYKHLDKFAKSEEREKMEELAKQIRTETYRMDVQLVGANPNLTISTEGKSQDYTQYYNHNALEVHSYSKITYHNVYPNIDWVIYTKGEQGLKYDFVVHPGGNPNQIKLQTNWVENLKLNQDGSLTLQNRMGNITEQTPISFQGENEIKTQFNIEYNTISFNLSEYNSAETLVIDPNLLWATYYGGSGNDGGLACTLDSSGNVYLAGETTSSNAISVGGHQNTFGGNPDAFLVKFNSAGVRLWATYYGGGDYDQGYSCVVDISGNVYLTGVSGSFTVIAAGGHQNTFGGGGADAFLVKFNSTGVRQWATYYGGMYQDYGTDCSVDGSGNVYLAGYTQSSTNIAAGGHQNTHGNAGGGNNEDDAFLVKFNSSGVRQWATYYGGNYIDEGFSCAVDGSGNVYLAGNAGPSNTNVIASGGHQNTFGGARDAFLVKFNSSGVRQWATYYGGGEYDMGTSCAVDGSGNVYLAGKTCSSSSIAVGGHQNTYGGGSLGSCIYGDAFLVKFNSAGVRQWATYYGGSEDEQGSSCALDGSGNVYLAGFTLSTTAIASGGYQNTLGGYRDVFLVKFNSSGVRQWATYYGGSSSEEGYSCTVDGSGNVYLTGETNSSTAIALNGHQNTLGVYEDAFLAKFGNAPVCVPSSFSFNDTICQGSAYLFNGINRTTAGAYEDTLQNAAGCDSFVTLNLSIKQTTSSTRTISACSSYIFNNQTLTQSGTYKDTLQNASGCDSIITLNLTVKSITVGKQTVKACGSYVFNNQLLKQSGTYKDTLTNRAGCDSIITLNLTIYAIPSPTVTASGFNLTTQSYAGYQWQLNVNNIASATSQNFTATVNGSYAVQVTDANGCSATSPAVQVTGVGIRDIAIVSISIYPSPALDFITIEAESKIASISIYDLTGKLVLKLDNINAFEKKIEINSLSSATYQILVKTTDGKTGINQFVKE